MRFRAEKVLKVFVQKSIDSRAASGHNQTVGRDGDSGVMVVWNLRS